MIDKRNKIIIVSLLNEQSGSCVSISELFKSLLKNDYYAELVTSEGLFFQEGNQVLNKNLSFLTYLVNYFRLNRELRRGDLVILNTLLCAPFVFLLFKARIILYVHEQGVGPRWGHKLLLKIINALRIRVAVVNPSMLIKYRNAFLLPNIVTVNENLVSAEGSKECTNSVLMISRATMKKGIGTLFELARRYPKSNFVLLTNKANATRQCLRFIELNQLPNLNVIFDQSRKQELLDASKYLLSLSHYDETFGYVLCEAVEANTIPISVINDGAEYCLNCSYKLTYTRQELISDFINILKYSEENRLQILQQLKRYYKNNFDEQIVLNLLLKNENLAAFKVK